MRRQLELSNDAAAALSGHEDAILRAIAQEEAAIRADPRSTGDPLLIGVFTLLR